MGLRIRVLSVVQTVVCVALLFQDMVTKLQVFLLEGASPLSSPVVGKGK